MSIDNLKETIIDILSPDSCSAEFYFLLDSGNGLEVKSIEINENAQNELSKIFINSITNSLILNDDLSLINLSGADDRNNAIYKYDLDDVPIGLSHLDQILENDDFQVFNFAHQNLSHLEGILILIGNEENQIALYKHQYPVTLLKKNSGFNILRAANSNRFEKLEEDILRVTPKFEFFKLNDEYYILDLKALEKFYGFHDAVKNIAKTGIENIENTNLVMNCDSFSDRLDDITFARKLVRSAKDSPVLGVIPNEVIIQFSKTHPALKNKFKYSDDGIQFNLKTKKSQNLFLKILNDDFLQSELTRKYYDSMAKDPIETETTE